jgi:hypothetical protein
MAFGDVIEDTTNKLLVTNVLRARDKAPLHFSDIPVIRESMSQTMLMGYNFVGGPVLGTTLRDTQSGSVSAVVSPSFDLNHLQSKEFITGISSPIDPKVVKYWLDRGLDRRMVLLLFFSSVEIVEVPADNGPVRTVKLMNSPREAVDIIRRRESLGKGEQRCDTQSDFERYLKLFNSLSTFFAHTYQERRVLAKGMNLDVEKESRNLQSFAALDQNKVQLVYDKGTKSYSLYAMSPEQKVSFCFYDNRDGAAGGSASRYESIQASATNSRDRSSCFQSIVEIPPEDSTRTIAAQMPLFFTGPAILPEPSNYCKIFNRFTGESKSVLNPEKSRLELRMHIRSVGEIFQFLGDLQYYQEEIARMNESGKYPALTLNSPLTFGYCAGDPSPGCNDVFFRLNEKSCNSRFSLNYRGSYYAVGNLNPVADASCPPQEANRKDHTLEILSVLDQLVNLNKSASDIRGTTSVQVLP